MVLLIHSLLSAALLQACWCHHLPLVRGTECTGLQSEDNKSNKSLFSFLENDSFYFFCSSLTGVSPFAGENDRATALNIRNYNVAFEEGMFSDLCKEAKGFVIKLLVVDRL